MRLLVIRHGIAMDREAFARTGQSDDHRPLTGKGERRVKRIAKGLRAQVKSIDLLATSPLTRAVQTADIIAATYRMGPPEVTASLVPEVSLEEFENFCSGLEGQDVVAIVGHEPHLSTLVTWLMTGQSESRVQLKKGGACLLEFESVAKRGSGTLSWLLGPRDIMRFARKK